MNRYLIIYNDIRALRIQGLTYSEINKTLGVNIPKSSLSYICRGIILSADQTDRINQLMKEELIKNRQKAITANRKLQDSLHKKIKTKASEFSNISNREAKIALALLYLGEGSKRSSFRGLALGSSDPNIILIYIGLMKRCYGIEAKEFKGRVLYREDQNLSELESHWSKLTGIPKANFYKSKPDPRTKGKPTLHKNYKGVCALYRKGTEIQLELQFIADIISENMGM